MYKYRIWFRISDTQTAHSYVWADNDYDAKAIAEAQFGIGSVLGYTRQED